MAGRRADLHANDAQADGRAIRWMIVAGGPGVGLVDMGEGEEANLATAKAMGEQRSRFMRARQQYFAWALATIALTAYNRAVGLGKVAGDWAGPLADIRIAVPDISPADNSELGAGGRAGGVGTLGPVRDQGVGGRTWRRLVVRTVLKYAGEPVDEAELRRILARVEADLAAAARGREEQANERTFDGDEDRTRGGRPGRVRGAVPGVRAAGST